VRIVCFQIDLNLELTDMLPGIMNQLGAENVWSLKNLAKTLSSVTEEAKASGLGSAMAGIDEDDDEVPQLVDNFDDVSKKAEVDESKE
jgi:nascent polypeptide-associated complex subunit beta